MFSTRHAAWGLALVAAVGDLVTSAAGVAIGAAELNPLTPTIVEMVILKVLVLGIAYAGYRLLSRDLYPYPGFTAPLAVAVVWTAAVVWNLAIIWILLH